jgi:hypothetical protein
MKPETVFLLREFDRIAKTRPTIATAMAMKIPAEIPPISRRVKLILYRL